MYFAVVKLLSLLAMFYQLTKLLKVQLSAILNHLLEIKDLIPDVQEPMQLLLDTQMMEQEQESDFHQVPEKLFLVAAEPLLVLLLVEEETKSQS
jgi:hypothetical protein